MCASGKGSGETVRLYRLIWAFTARILDKYQNHELLFCSIQIEGQLFSGDDTALNGVKLRCGDVKGHLVSDIESAEGDWGLWTEVISCNNHTGQNMSHDFIVAFQLQVERDQV